MRDSTLAISNVRYGSDEITNQTCPMRVAESALVVVQLTAVENPNGDVVVANQQACETSVHGETASVFRICDANVQGLDVQEAHIRARSKSERAPMKTFMYVQNLELRACTPLVPGIFWPRKIQNFGAPGMNAGVRPKHERIRTNTFTYVQVLDVHGKY